MMMIASIDSNDQPKEIKLTNWYVNMTRVAGVLGPGVLTGIGHDPSLLANEFGSRVLQWVGDHQVKSFTRLLQGDELKEGSVFFHEARFYSRGISDDSYSRPKDVTLRYPLKEIDPRRTGDLTILFNTSGITTNTAYGLLQRQTCVYVVGIVLDIQDKEVIASPLVIGKLHEDYGIFNPRYADSVEFRVDAFDAFKAVDFSLPVSQDNLNQLKRVPEPQIKAIFAEQMREPGTDKDWGGEIGDLFAANARIGGKLTNCGFMFKGPATFKKLEPADCGKNGDQIFRLFTYPADSFVLQHCHSVSPAVRATMRAFAIERISQRARFCVIDGYQTFAILKHLKKLPALSSL